MVEIEIDRGLTVAECKKLVEAPRDLPIDATTFQMYIHLRDEGLLRLLYETFARVEELLKVEIKDIDMEHGAIYIRFPKRKAIFVWENGKKIHKGSKTEPRWVYFSNETRSILIRYLRGRNKGYLIENSRGGRISKRSAERIVDAYATQVGIQMARGEDTMGRVLRLVTCKALRESGERHVDEAGGDRDATARIAGHTVRTKERYYKKGSFESDRRIIVAHHPLMKEEGSM